LGTPICTLPLSRIAHNAGRVPEALHRFFSSEIFLPQGHCYLWRPGLVWIEVVSNAIIALASLAMAALLVRRARRARQGDSAPPGRRVYAALGVAAAAYALTHLTGLWMIWHPAYWVDGGARVLSAAACAGAAIALATGPGSG
jgi:hypothetical protein